MPADAAHTTRRGFFGTVAALAAIAAVPALAEPVRDERQEFIDSVAFFHRNGRPVAERAMAAGWRPDECYCVMLWDRTPGNNMPALCFKRIRADGSQQLETFQPSGTL